MRIFLLLGITILLYTTSCQKNIVNTQKTLPQKGLIELPMCREDATYQVIKSNVARLQAMLNGKYIQYNARDTSAERPNYQVWRVNEGQDSVMLYVFPAGDPAKVGYWSFHYQVLTSLPDNPTSTHFEHFQLIDRDTIKSTFYAVPKEIELSLDTLLNNSEALFQDINFMKLQPLETNGSVYLRNNPLSFTDQTTSPTRGPMAKDWHTMSYKTTITPAGIDYEVTRSNDQTAQTKRSRFFKLGMIR